MNEYIITNGGLRIRDLNTNTMEVEGSDSNVPDATVDLFSDLEKAYYEFDTNTEFKDFTRMMELLGKVLLGSFSSVDDLMDAQTTNYDLDQAGWEFLVKVVKYLKLDAEIDYSDKVAKQGIDRLRIEIGYKFNYPTFKTTVRGEDLDNNTILSIRNNRVRDIDELRDTINFGRFPEDIITTFLVPLQGDMILAKQFVKMFLLGK